MNLKDMISNATKCQSKYSIESVVALTGNYFLRGSSPPETACVSVLDLASLHPRAIGFRKGFAGHDTFAYLAPGEHDVAVRLNVTSFRLADVRLVDLSLVDSRLGGYSGGFVNGAWACFR